MNIVIVGQGAIGLLWYQQLSKAPSNQVSLLCSARAKSPPPETLFTDINGQTISQSLTFATNKTINSADMVLICVKSYHIELALKRLSPQLNASCIIVFCHNGMISFDLFKPLSQPCYLLLTTHGSKVISPFHIQHTGLGHSDLGSISQQPTADLPRKTFKVLSEALPTLTLTDNIKTKQWLKLAINCVINPITAIHNIDNGQILDAKYKSLVDSLLKEIIMVAQLDGCAFEFNELKSQVLAVAEKTANNCSSMRSDILLNRRTEIDYINGYVVNLAEKNDIVLPENEKLLQQVRALGNS